MQLTPQEIDAVVAARDLLLRISKPRSEVRQWRPLRTEARALLRRFPAGTRLREILQRPIESEQD